MILPWQKPESKPRGPVLGGQDSLARLKNSLNSRRVKEPKKDASIFGGKPYLLRKDMVKKVKEDEKSDFFKKLKFDKNKREKLVNELLSEEMKLQMGPNIDRSDLAKAKKELDLGSQGKYKDLSQEERRDVKKLLENI